jgi:hypothetical protein
MHKILPAARLIMITTTFSIGLTGCAGWKHFPITDPKAAGLTDEQVSVYKVPDEYMFTHQIVRYEKDGTRTSLRNPNENGWITTAKLLPGQYYFQVSCSWQNGRVDLYGKYDIEPGYTYFLNCENSKINSSYYHLTNRRYPTKGGSLETSELVRQALQ